MRDNPYEVPHVRRWFRFSLRTLFVLVTVVALLAGWVAWSLNWVHQRQDALRTDGIYGNPNVHHSIYDKPHSPYGLWVFGETGQSTVIANSWMIPKDRIEVLRHLFPEANVWVRHHDGAKTIIPSVLSETEKSTVVVHDFMIAKDRIEELRHLYPEADVCVKHRGGSETVIPSLR